MKNKKDILVGVITIIATTGAMIFSLNYTSNAITENAHKNTIPIVINKKDENNNKESNNLLFKLFISIINV